MKKFLALLAFVAVIIGCNKELIVNAPWKDISIIYGILDGSKDTNYVRIHRGYLGNEGITGGNQEPDSLYYQSPDVKIEIINSNGNVIEVVNLIRDESKTLDSGFFTTEDYHTYRFDKQLVDNNQYRLIVNKSEAGLDSVWAQTVKVDDFNVKRPSATQSLNYTLGRGLRIIWNSTEHGRLYEVYTRLYYTEYDITSLDSVEKFVDYKASTRTSSNLNGGQEFTIEVAYDSYYRFLAANIDIDPDVIRFYRGTDIIINAASDDFTTYMNVSGPSNTVVQDKPHYTNIMGGDNANAGIFASSNTAIQEKLKMTNSSYDSLVQSMLTCDLQFVKIIQKDTCYCQGSIYPICL